MAALLSYIAQGLSADAVQKGRSLFAGKLGQTVGSGAGRPSSTTVLPPAAWPPTPSTGRACPGSAPRCSQAGVLQAYLHSSYTARKAGEGAASTGNAERGSYRSMPRVAASNLVLDPGSGTLDELLAPGRRRSLRGERRRSSLGSERHQRRDLGRRHRQADRERGARRGRCARSPSPPTSCRFLGSVSDLGGDARWIPLYGSVCTPSVAVERITVSGAVAAESRRGGWWTRKRWASRCWRPRIWRATSCCAPASGASTTWTSTCSRPIPRVLRGIVYELAVMVREQLAAGRGVPAAGRSGAGRGGAGCRAVAGAGHPAAPGAEEVQGVRDDQADRGPVRAGREGGHHRGHRHVGRSGHHGGRGSAGGGTRGARTSTAWSIGRRAGRRRQPPPGSLCARCSPRRSWVSLPSPERLGFWP